MIRRKSAGGVVFEIVLLLMSLGCLTQAFFTGTYTYKFIHLSTLTTTTATVRDVRNRGFTIEVEFLLPTNERVQIEQNVFLPRYHVSDQVPVIYDQAQPAAASLNSFSGLWFLPIVYSIPGLLFLLWGLSLFRERNL